MWDIFVVNLSPQEVTTALYLSSSSCHINWPPFRAFDLVEGSGNGRYCSVHHCWSHLVLLGVLPLSSAPTQYKRHLLSGSRSREVQRIHLVRFSLVTRHRGMKPSETFDGLSTRRHRTINNLRSRITKAVLFFFFNSIARCDDIGALGSMAGICEHRRSCRLPTRRLPFCPANDESRGKLESLCPRYTSRVPRVRIAWRCVGSSIIEALVDVVDFMASRGQKVGACNT